MRTTATKGSWLKTHPPGDTASSLRRLWRVGSKIDAVVLQRLSERTYLMRSGGLEWVAQSELPLEEKQRIRARVRSLEPVISLQVLGAPTPDAATEATGPPPSRLILVEFDDEYRAPVELIYGRTAKRSRRKNPLHHLAMLLDLEGLGTIGVHVVLNGRYVTFDFHCQDIETAEALQESAGDLERSLSLAKIVMSNLSIDLWPGNPPEVGSGKFQPQGYERIDWTV